MKYSRKKRMLIICFIFSIIILISNICIGIAFNGKVIVVGNRELPLLSLSGCISVVGLLANLLMIFLSLNKGLILSLGISTMYIVMNIVAIVKSNSLAATPGVFNNFMFYIILIFVYKQLKYTENKAIIDEVTGLHNSNSFQNAIGKMVYEKKNGFVLLASVDGFRPINANYGRYTGDTILRIIADRMEKILGAANCPYRLEGAQYAVILPEESDYQEIAKCISEAIEETISIERENGIVSSCNLSAYIGLVKINGAYDDVETILKHADAAMNQASKSVDKNICIYNDDIQKKIERDVLVEQVVKDCLRENKFYLVYQPQYTTEEKNLRGFETLIRMDRGSEDPIYPGEFIAIAERSNLIFDIDAYVLKRAMTEFKEVCNKNRNITLSINVSAKNIAKEDFADNVIKLVNEIEFPPECLEIEITEYSFADDESFTIDNIKKIREMDIKIAIDDFGTGYTSLEQLIKLPINLVKLDKSLIDNITASKVNADFIKSVIYLGHIMDAEVIAEGVEYQVQLEKLKEYKADFVQGFIWSKPLDYKEAIELA